MTRRARAVDREERLEVRFSEEEMQQLRTAAAAVNQPLATWSRAVLVSTATGQPYAVRDRARSASQVLPILR